MLERVLMQLFISLPLDRMGAKTCDSMACQEFTVMWRPLNFWIVTMITAFGEFLKVMSNCPDTSDARGWAL